MILSTQSFLNTSKNLERKINESTERKYKVLEARRKEEERKRVTKRRDAKGRGSKSTETESSSRYPIFNFDNIYFHLLKNKFLSIMPYLIHQFLKKITSFNKFFQWLYNEIYIVKHQIPMIPEKMRKVQMTMSSKFPKTYGSLNLERIPIGVMESRFDSHCKKSIILLERADQGKRPPTLILLLR